MADHVLVDVRVVNRASGRAIEGLTLDDFELYEDGVRQEITHASRDELPLSVALLMDVSCSVQEVLNELQKGALRALQHLKPGDEVALIAYGGFAQLIEDFTADRKLIAERIGTVNDFYLGTRNTALSEAVYQARSHVPGGQSGFPARDCRHYGRRGTG